MSNLLPVFKFVTEEQLEDINFMENRLNALILLDEVRRLAHEQNISKQQQVKFLHDKKSSERSFKAGDWVLKWNAKDQDKGKHGKFEALWLGPYIIFDKAGEQSYFLQDTEGHMQDFPVHGQYLKPFFQ